MATWTEFAVMAPELAAWGESRFKRARVAFLATIGADGSPHVYAVQPVICQGHLLLFADAASPKTADLKRHGRYAMHSLVDNPAGLGGEFIVKGTATLIDDGDIRRKAVEASCYTPKNDCVLFELSVSAALARDYEDGAIAETRWEPAYA
jgi:hypothetical protein